jgi:hypothetical protein
MAQFPKVVVAALIPLSVSAGARAAPSPAEQLLASYGAGQFPDLYRRALDTFLSAEDRYWAGDYEGAARMLGDLWAQHPPGSDDWARCPSQIAGINVGVPPCYYALRMLSDCAEWRLASVEHSSERPNRYTATLTVLLVGRSKGIQPTMWAELEDKVGREVEHTLDPQLLADRHHVIHQSVRLFSEYMLAATKGRLGVRTRVLGLPDVCVPVQAVAAPYRIAGLAGDAMERVWASVPAKVTASADWWWVLYPSHVPEQYPDFESTESITGGMGRGPDGASPCFIIDDRWLVRKPPHLGKGAYFGQERRAYLPQWLQHEFFHHLFACYPQFGLEAEGHQWFDRGTWPKDFEGRFEADYLQEALHKRLQPLGDPPMHFTLRYRPPPRALFRQVRLEALCGAYRREPVGNNWHAGTIGPDLGDHAEGEPVLRWTNMAGVSWRLWPNIEEGVLRTGADNPYYESNPTTGRVFRIVLRRDADGRYVPEVAGFHLQSDLYRREPE